MLDHVREDDHLEAPVRTLLGRELLHRLFTYIELEHPARVAGGRLGELEPGDRPAAPARLVEQQAVPAADVEQLAGRHVAPDQVEQPPRALAPAGLLAQVVVVGHPAVEPGQLVAARKRRLMDDSAVQAGVEIAVLAGVVVGRSHQLRGQRRGSARLAQLERALADATHGLGH